MIHPDNFIQISDKILYDIDSLEGRYNPDHNINTDFAHIDYKLLGMIEQLRHYCDYLFEEMQDKRNDDEETDENPIISEVDSRYQALLEDYQNFVTTTITTIDNVLDTDKNLMKALNRNRLERLLSNLNSKLDNLNDSE